jgi:hypothetical protein
MGYKLWLALVTMALPALAGDVRLLHQIREKDRIALVLPAGSCRAKVVKRDLNGLTVKFDRTTAACGKQKSQATLSREDVQDVVDDRRGFVRAPGMSPAANCAVLASTLVAVTAGVAIGEITGSNIGTLSAIVAGGALGAFVCRSRDPLYTVFADRIAPPP